MQALKLHSRPRRMFLQQFLKKGNGISKQKYLLLLIRHLVVLGSNYRRHLSSLSFRFIRNDNHVCKESPIPYLVFGSETLGNSPQTPNPPLSSSAFTNFAMSGWKRCSTSAAITRQNK